MKEEASRREEREEERERKTAYGRTRIIPGRKERIEMRESAGAEANDDRSPLPEALNSILASGDGRNTYRLVSAFLFISSSFPASHNSISPLTRGKLDARFSRGIRYSRIGFWRFSRRACSIAVEGCHRRRKDDARPCRFSRSSELSRRTCLDAVACTAALSTGACI